MATIFSCLSCIYRSYSNSILPEGTIALPAVLPLPKLGKVVRGNAYTQGKKPVAKHKPDPSKSIDFDENLWKTGSNRSKVVAFIKPGPGGSTSFFFDENHRF
jgi:hypothetical protein